MPLEDFHPAEDYHQKYYLRQDRKLFTAIEKIYPDPKRLRAATLAARANAYAGGNLTFEQFQEAVGMTDLPLSDQTAVIKSAAP